MREAVDQASSRAIDWEAVARAVRTLSSLSSLSSVSSAGDPPAKNPSGLTMATRVKQSTTLSANFDNRLSDFEKFDWD